ncbi:MAG: hypothetical protein Q7S28_01175 [bacterium]|nr:hypothetical protein [bacterium]
MAQFTITLEKQDLKELRDIVGVEWREYHGGLNVLRSPFFHTELKAFGPLSNLTLEEAYGSKGSDAGQAERWLADKVDHLERLCDKLKLAHKN